MLRAALLFLIIALVGGLAIDDSFQENVGVLPFTLKKLKSGPVGCKW